MLQFLSKLADRRRTPRRQEPRLRMRIDGHTYQSADWSLGGLRIEGYRGQARRLERISGTLTLPGGRKGDFLAEVMWQQGDQIGLRFIEVSPRVFFELSTLRPVEV